MAHRSSTLTGRDAGKAAFESVLPMIQELLAEAGITLKDCDAIAFGAGPGSFTGVRTACGISQGLAFGANLPVVPVVTLDAMALACRQQHGAERVLTVLDARMDEVYWAQYEFDADGMPRNVRGMRSITSIMASQTASMSRS